MLWQAQRVEDWDRRADLLLAGPRGRAACLSISRLWSPDYLSPSMTGDDDDKEPDWFLANEDRYQDDAIAGVARALAGLQVDRLRIDEKSCIRAVEESVGEAAYWQEPDADELLLADPRVVQALRPIARAVIGSPATAWWTDPLDPDDQFFVGWLWKKKQLRADPPLLVGAVERRTRWRAETIKDEADALQNRPPEHDARYTGSWWSTPVFSGLVATTPRLCDGTPAQLVFVEDPIGIRRARVARLQPRSDVRVFEIGQPADLIELVGRYPLPVDRARRHDWFRATGCRGPWLIPDWAAIGDDYAAVHLTVLGYLSTTGRALPVGKSYTMLAGWEPSETWWLNDVLDQASDPETWKQRSSFRWTPLVEKNSH